jgi:group I intron endonuclease
MSKFYVYRHTNIINNKIYIGKSNDPKGRWARHICDAKKNKNTGKQLLFHRAIIKYGSNNFTMDILSEHENNEEALKSETKFIELFDSNNTKIGYNLTSGGEGVVGFVRTSEQRKKISERNSGENNGMYGRIEGLEARKIRGLKISNTKQNNYSSPRKISKETIEKLKYAVKEKSSQNLTDHQKDQIIILYNSGKFLKRQLSEQFNVEIKTIIYVLRYWNEVKNNKSKYLTQLQKKYIIDLYLSGMYTKKQISEQTKIPFNRVVAVIKIYRNKSINMNKISSLCYGRSCSTQL